MYCNLHMSIPSYGCVSLPGQSHKVMLSLLVTKCHWIPPVTYRESAVFHLYVSQTHAMSTSHFPHSGKFKQLAQNIFGLTDKSNSHSLTYICACPVFMSSLHLYQLLEEYKWELSKDTCNSAHNFTPKRNELRYHCCLSQLYFIGH
jgi:hypothetical protein